MIDFPRRHRVPYHGRFRIGDFDTAPPKGSGTETRLENELKQSVDRLDELQRRLFADERHALLAVFQAMDAAGKDSTIRKVFSGVNPAGFRVHAFGRPSELELRHDFLQRVAAIREFEQHLARNGTAVVKFWLNVSRKEQKTRLLERIEDPEKNWKFRLGDLDDRALWHDYQAAYEAMLRATSRPYAPWYAIPADDKDYMRAAVARILVETLERMDPRYPRLGAAQRRQLQQGRRRLLAE
jgi:polyphosphate kinase 2 (PPK2 family)